MTTCTAMLWIWRDGRAQTPAARAKGCFVAVEWCSYSKGSAVDDGVLLLLDNFCLLSLAIRVEDYRCFIKHTPLELLAGQYEVSFHKYWYIWLGSWQVLFSYKCYSMSGIVIWPAWAGRWPHQTGKSSSGPQVNTRSLHLLSRMMSNAYRQNI